MSRDIHPQTKAWNSMPPREAMLDIFRARASGSDELESLAQEATATAVWRWASHSHDDAMRFSCELAATTAHRDDISSLIAGIAYLAACASRRQFPFNIEVYAEDVYDDEGGTNESYSASVRLRKDWTFPSPAIQKIAAYAFNSLVEFEDWEYRDGDHSGLDFACSNVEHFPTDYHNANPADWRTIASIAESSSLARELRSELPSGSGSAKRPTL